MQFSVYLDVSLSGDNLVRYMNLILYRVTVFQDFAPLPCIFSCNKKYFYYLPHIFEFWCKNNLPILLIFPSSNFIRRALSTYFISDRERRNHFCNEWCEKRGQILKQIILSKMMSLSCSFFIRNNCTSWYRH